CTRASGSHQTAYFAGTVILRSPRTTTFQSTTCFGTSRRPPWQAICWTEKGLKKCAVFVPKQDTEAGCLFSFSHNTHSPNQRDVERSRLNAPRYIYDHPTS